MLSTKLKEAAGNSADATLYVNDVFSTYLYTGNGSTQSIVNGIDLSTKGGLLWIKARNTLTTPPANANWNHLFDSARGFANDINSNETGGQYNQGTVTATSSGFSLSSGGTSAPNDNAGNYVSWTFRKAAKFFDVVTYTGDGTSNRAIAHSLGTTVGMVMTKSTSATGGWNTYHRSATGDLVLNTTAAQTGSHAIVVSATDSTFTVTGVANTNGVTYVAYLFAHDTSSTGIIQCGSYTATGLVNLGFEPQYILSRCATTGANWKINDSMRGIAGSTTASLAANSSAAEENSTMDITLAANGFNVNTLQDGAGTYIYMAIRRPNKPPTSGTQVFMPTTWAGNGNTGLTVSSLTSPVDLAIVSGRGGQDPKLIFSDRLRGSGTGENSGNMRTLTSSSAVEESATSLNGYYATLDYQNSVRLLGSSSGIYNGGGASYVLYSFKRAPGFFDEVCYTGTGVATTQAHNLGVVPTLMIVKKRSGVADWPVYNSSLGINGFLYSNLDNADGNETGAFWNNTTPTTSVFSLGTGGYVNAYGSTYVAYLFATLAGISKVGSYTGNGSSQNIECGFAAGARFFLVKATSTTGSWWVWDSARGITSGNDPALQLNSAAAEITTADAVDPYSPGITVNQEATCSINASGVSYIFLAVA